MKATLTLDEAMVETGKIYEMISHIEGVKNVKISIGEVMVRVEPRPGFRVQEEVERCATEIEEAWGGLPDGFVIETPPEEPLEGMVKVDG